MSALMCEARCLLDSVIDESLKCQEEILRKSTNGVPEFAKSFEKIIDVSKKVTESFFKVLET